MQLSCGIAMSRQADIACSFVRPSEEESKKWADRIRPIICLLI